MTWARDAVPFWYQKLQKDPKSIHELYFLRPLSTSYPPLCHCQLSIDDLWFRLFHFLTNHSEISTLSISKTCLDTFTKQSILGLKEFLSTNKLKIFQCGFHENLDDILSSISEIEQLDLSQHAQEKGYDYFKKMSKSAKVKHLNLNNSPFLISNTEIWSQFETLDLSNSNVSFDMLTVILENAQQLESLMLFGASLSQEELNQLLPYLKNLKRISISPADERSIYSLNNFLSQNFLKLESQQLENFSFDYINWSLIARQMPNLKNFTMKNFSVIGSTDNDLQNSDIKESFEYLEKVEFMKSQQKFDLSNLQLSRLNAPLKTLVLHQLIQTSISVSELLNQFPLLNNLDLSCNPLLFTDELIQEINSEKSGLKICLGGCLEHLSDSEEKEKLMNRLQNIPQLILK